MGLADVCATSKELEAIIYYKKTLAIPEQLFVRFQ